MKADPRRRRLVENIAKGMKPAAAARDAGYSDSYCNVNVYAVVKDPAFQAEVARHQHPGLSIQVLEPARVIESQAESEPLSPREELFINFYLGEANMVGKDAARLAGYQGDNTQLAQMAFKLRRKPRIASRISEILSVTAMDRDEALARMSRFGRGRITDVCDDDGKVDLKVARERGHDGLIKKLKTRRRIERAKDGTETEFIEHDVEIHDALRATELIGKAHGLFDSKTEETGDLADSVRGLVELLRSAAQKHQQRLQAAAIDVTPR